MMKIAKVLLGIIVLLGFFSNDAIAQKDRRKKKEDKVASIYDVDTLINPIPKKRELFTYYVDAEQKKADMYDGIQDHAINTGDEIYSNILTKAIMKDVDQLQIMIENLPYPNTIDEFKSNNERISFYRSLEALVKKFNQNPRRDALYYKRLVENFKAFLIARNKNELETFFKENATVYTFDNISLLDPAKPELKKELLMELGRNEPRLMISRLPEFASEPYSGDVVAPAAKLVPSEIFNFASSSNLTYANAIKRSSDPLMQTIVKIAQQSKEPLKALPFLADIHSGKMTVAEIDKITANEDLFFKNLVRLKMENEQLGGNTFTDELAYRGMRYVRKINELHDSPDPVRFKILEGLSAEELYFIMVYGQNEIYTSSFIGAFNRMMERMKPTTGDEFLQKVHYDKFRSFIRMTAGYNVLSTFLASMNNDAQTKLIQDFVDNLEDGSDEDLEGAVDVADAYGSITDQQLISFMKNRVKEGYERSVSKRSSKGLKVYALLTTIFEGSQTVKDDATADRQSELLNLPSINNVPYEKLLDDNQSVVQRVFFYGDEDGKISYANFQGNFKDGKWKQEVTKYWVTYTSTVGKPITIYANLPLTEPEDETAQKELNKFLYEKNIHPSIIVHRGHSYHLPTTLEHLDDKVKIVVLGSCGGFHNLAQVLDASPDAHIISSKQTGAMAINDPIIREINGTLREGKAVDWIDMWKNLDNYFKDKPTSVKKLYSDYVPPYKNLGAIFIKAYRRLSAQENME